VVGERAAQLYLAVLHRGLEAPQRHQPLLVLGARRVLELLVDLGLEHFWLMALRLTADDPKPRIAGVERRLQGLVVIARGARSCPCGASSGRASSPPAPSSYA